MDPGAERILRIGAATMHGRRAGEPRSADEVVTDGGDGNQPGQGLGREPDDDKVARQCELVSEIPAGP